MSGTQLAAQIYTVRDKIKEHPESLPEIFRKIREIGYEAVELVRQVIEDPAQTRKQASDAGLEICSVHLSADRIFADPDYVIEMKEILGTHHVVIPSMPQPLRGSADGARQLAEELQKAGERLAKAGITLSYHNHSFEFQKFDGKTAFETILDLTKPEHVKIEFDTYWVQHGGGDVAAWLRRLGDRVSLLHLKDMGMVLRDQIFVEVGEGNLNWPAILDAARAANVRWYIVELDTCPRDSFESLAISYRNCRAMGLE
jgi:sugar phosphate isomerase/epimerase